MSFLLRPIEAQDFEALCSFAKIAQYGITSLPNDPAILQKKLERSIKSFHADVQIPIDELYLFVLEDVENRKVIGLSGIASRIGVEEPFYSFRTQEFESACPSLGIYKKHATLHLSEARKGPTEICSLFLLPEYRAKGLAKLLSYARFLFMKAFPERFHPMIVAEMRGVTHENGECPFWDNVMRPFFSMSFPEANLQRAKSEAFIADLIPRTPLYVDMLHKDAQAVIGKTHPFTSAALKLLYHEGFEFFNEIDIFDGGPDIYASLKEIKTVKESTRGCVKEISSVQSEPYLISNASLNFRATYGSLKGNVLDKNAATLLKLEPGNSFDSIKQH